MHGTTGAPRDIARSPVPPGQPSESSGGPPRGLARLAGVVCGRWTKFAVVGIWLLIMVAASPFAGIDSTTSYGTLAVVVVLLLLTYRSPVLWLLPILSAGVALTAAEAVIHYLTQHANLTVNGQTERILVVLVIGASTDYALLLIARYRDELRRHENRHAAMAVALRRAGPAILASALTVVAGMLCLMAAESNDSSGLGPVAAIGIAVGVIAMVTLLPAILVVFGRWIFWPVRPDFGSAEPTSRGLWSRVGALIARRPRLVWMLTAVLLAAGVAGVAGFGFGTLTVAQSFRDHRPVAAGHVAEPGPRPADMVAKLTVPSGRGERFCEAGRLNWVA